MEMAIEATAELLATPPSSFCRVGGADSVALSAAC